MGKGDKKSKKGKIWRASYGVSRNRKTIKARLKRLASRPAVTTTDSAVEKPKAKRTTKKKEAAAE